jgi:hypothetical protein
MAIFEIDPVTKERILKERIAQFSVEGYQHELNKLTAEAIGNAQAVVEADQAIVTIQTAIQVAQNELGNI